LPKKYFKQLCSSDDLNLEQESKLIKLVKEYIHIREDLVDEVKKKKEAAGTLEERSKSFWKHLNKDE
jgi:hypothetical protein